MKHRVSRGSRTRLLAIVLGLGCVPAALAEPLPFIGRWLADDRTDEQAARTILTINDGSLAWRGPDTSAPACVQPFLLKKEKPGTVYADGRGTRFVAGAPGSLPTYLLQLGAGDCGSAVAEMRVSFPLVYDTRHIELIEYVHGKAVSSRRFHRKK